MAKDKVMAGPVYPAATVPVMENNPADGKRLSYPHSG